MALESQPNDNFSLLIHCSNLRKCVFNTHSHYSGLPLSVKSNQKYEMVNDQA